MDKKSKEKILILSSGHEYDQFLTRKVRELGVYSELHSEQLTLDDIRVMNPRGIIITGAPIDDQLFNIDMPMLVIGEGLNVISEKFAKQMESSLEEMDDHSLIHVEGNIYGMKDHPAALKGKEKAKVFEEFLFTVCQCTGEWTADTFIQTEIDKIQKQVGDRKVLCALSGGVDSSVVAALMHRAIGDQLTCIFVDNGLLRKNEGRDVMKLFADQLAVNIINIDAEERFLTKLKGISDPEEKRKRIGNEFIYVFDEEAAKLKDIAFLAQGTLYSDVIETGEDGEGIKSHHNVGGLPEDMELSLIEPLRILFKDEVRAVGTALGLPNSIVWRQPFPGPGLAIRILGEVTEEKLHIVRESDAILREEIAEAGLERDIWQYFAVLPGIRSVGMTSGKRTYDHTIGIRAVHSIDGMTSEWARIPWDTLDKISHRIVEEVQHVNRVVYDITSKPPATIEWE